MGTFNSAKDAKGFEEVKGLVEELEMVESRPYAPDAPDPFKQELRGRLLQEHERSGLSWAEMGRLWRFAGTAVAIVLLMVAVGLFWASLSNRNTAVGPAADTVIVATRTAVPEVTPTPVPMSQTFMESDVVSASNSPAQVVFGDGIQLEQYEIEEQENGLQLRLGWQPTNWPENVQLFVHLLNENGELISQTDTQLSRSEQDVILLQPELDGRYDIIIGLYNPATRQRLPVTADNERMVVDGGTAVWLTDWEFTNEATDRVWIITATQKARPSANSMIELDMNLGYTLTSTEELFLKLHYAAPDWETVVDGRAPIDSMSDWIPLNPNENNIIITFTGNPAEMEQIVGTDRPALVVQLGYFEEGVNGRELKILFAHTFANYPIDLSNSAEIRLDVFP